MRITEKMVGADVNLSPDDLDVQAAIGEQHAYINKYLYACDVAFMRNLTDIWVEDARFAANCEQICIGRAKFVREAVHIFCDANE